MSTKRGTVSVRLQNETKRQVEMAARITGQSAGAFLGKAGQDRAHQVLLDWATSTYRQGDTTYSKLAEETGLAVEEIMMAMSQSSKDDGLDMYLASCRTLAEIHDDPEFLRLAEDAVKRVRSERPAA